MPPTAAPAPRSLTIVLPAYNESDRIGPALDELFEYLATAPAGVPAQVDVLVIDDGSRDDPAAIVEARAAASGASAAGASGATPPAGAPLLRVLRAPHAGKGAAVRRGMLAAEGELVIF